MQQKQTKTIYKTITEAITKLGISLTLDQEQEMDDFIYNLFGDQETDYFNCNYCDKTYPLSQKIWEDITDDISFLMCESCYLEGLDQSNKVEDLNNVPIW